MLGLRFLSTIVLLPPVILVTYYGHPYFEVMTALFALVMALEWDRMCRRHPGWLVVGALYIGAPVAALLWLRAVAGMETVFWLFVVVWATDIAAYLVGRLVGGPLLAPAISPKKTWSGAVGGITAAVAVGYGTAAVLHTSGVVVIMLASVGVSIIAEAGDLLESKMKRRFGVKDSGRIIPGHGGVLDRVDGLLTAAPFAAVGVWFAGGGVLLWR
ncbi:MAG: phosphatidate cytidylyltransferase [Alphaproteobacteria bacterium]|nr:phosphatidate cytidylyltransferase [Alphaproteobacteria bacterium]